MPAPEIELDLYDVPDPSPMAVHDPLDEHRRLIKSCNTIDDLSNALVHLRRLPEEIKAQLRPLFAERRAMIQRTRVPVSIEQVMGQSLQPANDASTGTLTEALQAVAVEVSQTLIDAARGVVGLTAADVNPVANMANPEAQAAVTYLDPGSAARAALPTAAYTPIVRVTQAEGNPDGYAPTPETLAQVEATRARQKAARAERRTPRVAASIVPASDGTLTRAACVAGAAAEGHGTILSWDGRGTMSRSTMRGIAVVHGVEPLKAHSARHYLGTCVQAYNQRGYVARSSKRVKTSQETYKARWVVGSPDFSETSDTLGHRVLTVTLNADDSITYVPHNAAGEQIESEIRAEYTRLSDGEIYAAGTVTEWIVDTLDVRCGSIRAWGGYFTRREHAAWAEAFCNSIKAVGWGVWTGLPALPVATSAQLMAGLSNGLISECNAVLAKLEAARQGLDADKDIGPARAASLLTELDKVSAKLTAHAELLGEAHVADVRRCVTEAREVLRPLTDETSQRFANIADEIRGEITK